MTRFRPAALAAILIALGGLALMGCASAPPPRVDHFTGVDTSFDPLEITEVEGVARRLFLDGRVYVSGQPSLEALAALQDLGVTAVVNLRTPREMDDRERVPYDEAAAADSLGLAYLTLPVGGADHPYRPSVLSGLEEVLKKHPGKILLHCGSGYRASQVWAGYLVKYRGWSLDQGYRRGTAIGISEHPLQGLLDKELVLRER